MKKIITTILACVAIAACSVTHGPTPPPNPPPPPPVPNAADCQAACDNLQHLGCEEGNPIDVGTPCKVDADCGLPMACSAQGYCMIPCVSWCEDLMSKGVNLNPTCVKSITVCSDIEVKCQVGNLN